MTKKKLISHFKLLVGLLKLNLTFILFDITTIGFETQPHTQGNILSTGLPRYNHGFMAKKNSSVLRSTYRVQSKS